MRSKTFWGIIFILFIFLAGFFVGYQLYNAPKQALVFVASTGKDVFEGDIVLRRNLIEIDDYVNQKNVNKTINTQLLEDVKLELESINETNQELKSRVSSLTAIEKWALDQYDFILDQRVDTVDETINKINNQINFSLDNFDVVNDYYLLIDDLNNDRGASCEIVIEKVNNFNNFLPKLNEHMIENIISLDYQKGVLEYIDFYVDLNSEIINKSNSGNCDSFDSISFETTPSYPYYPETRIYINQSYISNLESVTDKLQSLIDNL